MKKKLSIIGIVLGIIITAMGMIMRYKKSFSASIIGGTDGPTSIFLVGKVGGNFAWSFIIIGVTLIVIAIIIKIVKNSKK